MSPEYAMEGLFSIKSDVYSFGVLMFDIITGKKNTSYYYHDNPESNLIGHECAFDKIMLKISKINCQFTC